MTVGTMMAEGRAATTGVMTGGMTTTGAARATIKAGRTIGVIVPGGE
jgi:hypothetical protein